MMLATEFETAIPWLPMPDAPQVESMAAMIRGTVYATSGEVGGIIIAEGGIASTNYEPGEDGFALLADGSAEFNNVTVRGTLIAGTIIESGAVIQDGVEIEASAFSAENPVFTGAIVLQLNEETNLIEFGLHGASVSSGMKMIAVGGSGTEGFIGTNADGLALWSDVDVAIDVGEYLKITGIPTSNPGGSGRVWNDGGTLRIT